MAPEWSNWAGNVRARPSKIAKPRSEGELAACVREAAESGLGVRVVGTGHSFMPLVATDGVLISLDSFAGVEAHDREALTATVRAGTKIHDLGDPLLGYGLALENQGDVDVQSVGGALGTGTHGTGRTLRNMSANVLGARLVTADGDVVECSETHDPELLRAARVSLGLLGVFASVTLRVVPAYRLHERVWRAETDACLDELDQHVAQNRHFEFFWFPGLDRVEMKTLNPTEDPPGELPAEGERVGWSCHVISSVRELKFHEMEYSVPAEEGPVCFRAVRDRIREKHPNVVWPVEYRTLAPDDAPLSPAYERPTVTISVHQDARLPFRGFFADVEAVFAEHRGRPHWGKIHTRTRQELSDLYPEWETFCAQRARTDPAGRFLNEHLRGLFAGT